jgi:hypothetical protein
LGRSGQRRQAAEPGSVRAAGEITLAQRRRDRPVECGEDGVVVGENGTFVVSVGIKEVIAIVGEGGSFEVENLRATVKTLVDDFARVVFRWIVAEQCVCASCRVDTTALQLNPWVGETALGAKCGAESCVGCAGVSCVRVSHDKDGVASRPGADVVSDLLHVGVASYVVLVFVASLLSVSSHSAELFKLTQHQRASCTHQYKHPQTRSSA